MTPDFNNICFSHEEVTFLKSQKFERMKVKKNEITINVPPLQKLSDI